MVDAVDTVATRGRAPTRPVPLWLLRLAVTAHALAVFTQPVLAGQFLDGDFDLVAVHGGVAILIELLALVQIVFAVLLRWPGRGPLWPLMVSVPVLLAEGAQVGAGYTRQLALHVPLGVAIVAGMLLLLVAVWRPGFGRSRPVRSTWEEGSDGLDTP